MLFYNFMVATKVTLINDINGMDILSNYKHEMGDCMFSWCLTIIRKHALEHIRKDEFPTAHHTSSQKPIFISGCQC